MRARRSPTCRSRTRRSKSEFEGLKLLEVTPERPSEACAAEAPPDGLSLSTDFVPAATLGSLPVGARLILRCRADWRAATVASFETQLGRVVLNVASPTGHTY